MMSPHLKNIISAAATSVSGYSSSFLLLLLLHYLLVIIILHQVSRANWSKGYASTQSVWARTLTSPLLFPCHQSAVQKIFFVIILLLIRRVHNRKFEGSQLSGVTGICFYLTKMCANLISQWWWWKLAPNGWALWSENSRICTGRDRWWVWYIGRQVKS
jgi:hypothetical protein